LVKSVRVQFVALATIHVMLNRVASTAMLTTFTIALHIHTLALDRLVLFLPGLAP